MTPHGAPPPRPLSQAPSQCLPPPHSPFPSLHFLFLWELPRDWATVGPAGVDGTQWNPCEMLDPSRPLPKGPVEHSSALPKTSLNLVPLENQTEPVWRGEGFFSAPGACPPPLPTPLPLQGPRPWSKPHDQSQLSASLGFSGFMRSASSFFLRCPQSPCNCVSVPQTSVGPSKCERTTTRKPWLGSGEQALWWGKGRCPLPGGCVIRSIYCV